MTLRRAHRLCFAVAGLLFWTADAARAEEGPSVVVVVEGAGSEALAAGIAAHIEPHALRDPRGFRAALAARGTKALGPAAGNRARDAQLLARAHAAAADAHVDTAI